MPVTDTANPLRATKINSVDFLGSLSFAAYAIGSTSPWETDGNLLIENLLDPTSPIDPLPAPPLPPAPANALPPLAQQNPNDRSFDARQSSFQQFYFTPVSALSPSTGTLTLQFDSWRAVCAVALENPYRSDDLVITFDDGSLLILGNFLSPAHKSSPLTQVRLAVDNGTGVDVVTQSMSAFLVDRLAPTPFPDLVAWYADSLGSGGGAHALMHALLTLAQREFQAGHLDASMFDLDGLYDIRNYFQEGTEHLTQTAFYNDFIDRLRTGHFTADDVQVYTLMRVLRSDSRESTDAPYLDQDISRDHMAKAAFFAGYQASVEAVATQETLPLDRLRAQSPTPMAASPLVDVTLKAMQADLATHDAVHRLFRTGTATVQGAEVSLYLVHPSELPAGANGALVTDAAGRRLLLVSQLLDQSWRNVVVAEELASLLAQPWEAQTHTELPGDEGRYVLTRLVRDIVRGVRSGGPQASQWQAAYDALPVSWTRLRDAEFDQWVVRASLSNDKHVVVADGNNYTYELSSFGDWTAPVAGAIAGVITGAALGTAGLLVAGPAGAALGAKAGLETGLVVAGLSALGGGAIGGVAGAAYASAQESQSLQQDIAHRLNPAAPSSASDTLEQTFRKAAYAAPTDVDDVLALLRAGVSYGDIMAMPGVDKVALARESHLLPQYGYDNPYFSNLDNAFGFQSLGSTLEASQRQRIEQRIKANLPFDDQLNVARELFVLGNARGMLGNVLKSADVQGIDLVLQLYHNLRFAYQQSATHKLFNDIDPLAWGGELGFWAVNEKTKSSGEDISAKFMTNGDYQDSEGALADMAFAQLTSLLEKSDMLRLLSANKMADLLRYLTHTTLMSQAADLEMLRLAHALETQPTQELVADVFSLLMGSAAGGIKTIEERGFRLLAAQTQALADAGAVSPEWSFLSDQVKQVVQGFNQDVLLPLSEEGKVIGPVHEAGFGEFGPVALMQGARWEDMLFSQTPLASGWVLDPKLVTYINTQHPFLQDNGDPANSSVGVFSAMHWQQLLRDGTASDITGKFIVSLRWVDPQTMGGLPGQVAARVGADGRHHIEVLISRDLSPADRDGVLFEELNNVDEYIYSSRHETDPLHHPLIDTITVGDHGGRALLSYEMYLRTVFNKGLPMFAHLSDASLGYAMKAETLNDDRYVDSVLLREGVPETVTLYANTISSVNHPSSSGFISIRPAFYLSTHTGYATAQNISVLAPFFKSYVDLSRIRFQFSLDPVAKASQSGESTPDKARPVSDSWASFDITLENLSSLQLYPGTQLPNSTALFPMLWDLSTWSTDVSGIGQNYKKSPSFSYQTGFAGGFTDRPAVAPVDARSEAVQAQIDHLQAKVARATGTPAQKTEWTQKLTQAKLDLTTLDDYKNQLIDLGDEHSGHVNVSTGVRFGGYLFGLRDYTRAVDTGIDLLDNHALNTDITGVLGAVASGAARATGLGLHERSGYAAVGAFAARAASQIAASAEAETWFNQDLGLFDNNGIHRAEVLEQYGLGNGPDGQPNAQRQNYLSLVEAGQSAGLTPLARSWLSGIALQAFWGLQVKKDIAVTQAHRSGVDERELQSQESINRMRNQEMDRAMIEIRFDQDNQDSPPVPPPAPAEPGHSFVYAPHHFEFNVGFFISSGARYDVTTAGTKVETSRLETPVWQQGVMGV